MDDGDFQHISENSDIFDRIEKGRIVSISKRSGFAAPFEVFDSMDPIFPMLS
jgi:hypothetical protein